MTRLSVQRIFAFFHPLRFSTHLFHTTADVDNLVAALLDTVPHPWRHHSSTATAGHPEGRPRKVRSATAASRGRLGVE